MTTDQAYIDGLVRDAVTQAAQAYSGEREPTLLYVSFGDAGVTALFTTTSNDIETAGMARAMIGTAVAELYRKVI